MGPASSELVEQQIGQGMSAGDEVIWLPRTLAVRIWGALAV